MKIRSLLGNFGYEGEVTWPRWKWRNHEGQVEEVEEQNSIIDAPQSDVSHLCSMVTLEHPTGKWWESLFIPTHRTGNIGISITTWGRKAGAQGSAQVKIVSENDWYNIAHSKWGAGGYGVLTYMGRESGLSSGQANALMNLKAHKVPPAGLVREAAENLSTNKGEVGMLHALAESLLDVTPIEALMVKLMRNTHDPVNSLNILQREPSTPNKMAPAIEAIKTGLAQGLDGLGWATGTIAPRARNTAPPEPAINREEVYEGTWGAFG